MGYSTDFEGAFTLNKPLTVAQANYLRAFAETRRMKRDADKTKLRPDPVREAAGLPVGADGEYFVGETGYAGQDAGPDVTDSNSAPRRELSLWNHWVPTHDATGLQWDGGEKFYSYVEWLNYIIEHFLKRWGLEISGHVEYQGESRDDFGFVVIKDGRAVAVAGKRKMPKI